MHVRTCGDPHGIGTFVLEAGLGGTSDGWVHLERQLARQGLVINYERAGIGSSEGPAGSAAPDDIAGRLSALLAKLPIGKPYILIGYSMGGLYARYFAATHPQDLAGLVLIDPTPDHLRRSRMLDWIAWLLMWALHLLCKSGLFGALSKVLRRGRAISPEQGQRLAALKNPRHIRSVLLELKTLGSIQAQVRGLPPINRLPVLCLSAGEIAKSAGTPEQIAAIRRHHEQLAEEGQAPWSRHHSIPGATHGTLMSEPGFAAILARYILDFSRRAFAGPPAQS